MRLLPPAVLAVLLLAPLPAAASDAPPDTFTVELEGGETKTAVKVQPRAERTVALTMEDGRVEYVPMSRIRSIRDRKGTDLAHFVTRDRYSLPLPAPPSGASPRWTPVRFRAGPPSACRAYLITDCALLRRIASETSPGHEDDLVLVEYGYARNFGSHHSVGLTGFLQVDDEHNQKGLRLRFVRWLGPSLSLNLSPGIVLASAQSAIKAPGFSTQAGLTLSGRIGLVVEVFSVGARVGTLSGNEFIVSEGHETAWYAGLKLGGEPGMLGTLPALLFAALMSGEGTR